MGSRVPIKFAGLQNPFFGFCNNKNFYFCFFSYGAGLETVVDCKKCIDQAGADIRLTYKKMNDIVKTVVGKRKVDEKMAYGKSVNLFLVNGKADSLVVAMLSNWNATALRIPRIEVSGCDRSELQQPGVYFLICTDQDSGEKSVYIGESDNVRMRLLQHMQDYNSEKEKYYWNVAICFTGPIVSVGNVAATGEVTADGFVVFKGASLNKTTNINSLGKHAAEKRDAILSGEKVKNLVTTEDILFTSPSAAADFLLGYSVSGPATWKDKNGVSLKDRKDL